MWYMDMWQNEIDMREKAETELRKLQAILDENQHHTRPRIPSKVSQCRAAEVFHFQCCPRPVAVTCPGSRGGEEGDLNVVDPFRGADLLAFARIWAAASLAVLPALSIQMYSRCFPVQGVWIECVLSSRGNGIELYYCKSTTLLGERFEDTHIQLGRSVTTVEETWSLLSLLDSRIELPLVERFV